MNNLMEWNGLFSAENIRFEIYRRPSADAVGVQIWTFLPNDIFAINIKRQSIYRLYVCDFLYSQSQSYPLIYGHYINVHFGDSAGDF
jgi:hypothetical protein